MMKRLSVMMLSVLMLVVSIGTSNADRLKDLTSIASIRSNQLVGYGVVVGLAGTGDGNSGLTLQSLQSMVSQFGLVTDSANLSAKNAAAVMVTAELPAFMKPGQQFDITISTIGGAKSLRGGTLMMTPMPLNQKVSALLRVMRFDKPIGTFLLLAPDQTIYLIENMFL